MASRMLGSLLGGRAGAGRRSPAAAKPRQHAATGAARARAVPVSLTQVFFRARAAAFTSAVNNSDAAPATGSEEDRERTAAEDGPASRAAPEKAADDVAGKARGAAEEVKEAGRHVKDRAKEGGDRGP